MSAIQCKGKDESYGHKGPRVWGKHRGLETQSVLFSCYIYELQSEIRLLEYGNKR